ncbi:hypothetical protein DPMN_163433 [Dreissena polymorpha]|uniref:Uncharacterized protein n=1 Tax=Dreissena polymorpha TaxID=45954 RepID=A0A9D4IRC3_DREPO|nr:hypothetical protein DPMN_163433 [Dreissena polymorpha]
MLNLTSKNTRTNKNACKKPRHAKMCPISALAQSGQELPCLCPISALAQCGIELPCLCPISALAQCGQELPCLCPISALAQCGQELPCLCPISALAQCGQELPCLIISRQNMTLKPIAYFLTTLRDCADWSEVTQGAYYIRPILA